MTSRRKKKAEYLKYSTTIRLTAKNNSHTFAARGSHIPRVYSLENSQGSEELINFYPNFQDTLFQIIPKLNFEANEIILETEKTHPRYETFEKRKKIEDELNMNLIKDMEGQNIKLGDEVQLFHPASGMFLSLSGSKAPYGNHTLLTMSDKSSKDTQFKIKSPLAFRKIGSLIIVGDEFGFINENKMVVYPIDKTLNDYNIIGLKRVGGEKNLKKFRDMVPQNPLRLSSCPEIQKMFKPVLSGAMLELDKGDQYSSDFQARLIDYQPGMLTFDESPSFRWGDYITISKMEESGAANSIFSECNVSGLRNTLLMRMEKQLQSRFLNNIEGIFQLVPKMSHQLGKLIYFNGYREADVYLRHVLTGKLVYLNPETGLLELANDFGFYKEYIKVNKWKIKKKWEARKEEYWDILDDDTIPTKDEILKQKFTNAEIKDYNKLETVCEHEQLFDNQYCRDTLINLKVSSKGDKNLMGSSYFSLRNYHAETIVSIMDEEKYNSMKQAEKVEDRYHEKTFNYDEHYKIEVLKSEKNLAAPDQTIETYFYFEKARNIDVLLIESLSATLTDFVRYLRAGVENLDNAPTVLIALDHIMKNMTSLSLTRIQFQHFLRQSCIVDIMMRILQDIYSSNMFNPESIKIPVKIFNEISKLLQKFIDENQTCADYLYQWKSFYREFLGNQRLLHEKVPYFGILISTIFEMTGSYEEYLQYNLENTCKKIDFPLFCKNELGQFLKMLRTSQKMNDGKIDNFVMETVVFSDYFDKIFYPMQVNDIPGDKPRSQIKVSNGLTLTLNAEFTFSQELESNYLKNLVNAASIISSLAPNRVYDKMSSKYPKDACLMNILNKSLSQGLRGAFVYLYKSLYIQKEIINNEVADVKTNILVTRDERYDFLRSNNQNIYSVKQNSFKADNMNLVEVIFKNFDIKSQEFARSIIDLSLFAIDNSIFDKTEFRHLEKTIKKILMDHGPPIKGSKSFRKFSMTGTIKSISSVKNPEETDDDDKMIKVSKLQQVDWMAGAIQILLKCLEFNYGQIYERFATIEAKKLKIDGPSLRESYKMIDVMDLDDEIMKKDRNRIKSFMDSQTTENESYPKIMLELVNPKYPELSESVLEYLDTIIIRDELTLADFKNRFSLSKKVEPEVKTDFDDMLEFCYEARRSIEVINMSTQQKEVEKAKFHFFELKKKLHTIVANIFRIIEIDDQNKKNEVNFDMILNGDIYVEDFEISKFDKVLKKESTFFFNILNNFLGKSTNYKNRKEILLDMKILEKFPRMIMDLYKFTKVFEIDLDAIAQKFEHPDLLPGVEPEKLEPFNFDEVYVKGNVLGYKLSELLLFYLLLGNYVFIRPSSYNRDFLLNSLTDLLDLGKILLSPKNKFSTKIVLLFLKFLISIMRDNYTVLVSIQNELIDFLFSKFSEFLDEENYDVSIALFEVFETIVEFRGTGVIENVNQVYTRLMEIINARKSKLRKLINEDIEQWLKKTPTESATINYDMTNYNWKAFFSEGAYKLGMTKEKPPIYDCSLIPKQFTLVTKVFGIMSIFLTAKNPNIEAALRSTVSLGYLVNLIKHGSSWYPIKAVVIELMKKLYVNKSIVAGNLAILNAAVDNELFADFNEFETIRTSISGFNDLIITTDIDSIKHTYFEETVYKAYFGHLCWCNRNSFEDYAVYGIGKLLYEYLTVLELPGKLKNLDISAVWRYNNIFFEYNTEKGRTGNLLKIKKSSFKARKKDNTKNDQFALKFKDDNEEDEDNFDGVLDSIDDVKNEYIMYENYFSINSFKKKKEHYLGEVAAKSVANDLDVEELQILKKELFSKEFIFSVNAEDYYQFMNTTLDVLKKEEFKFEMFLKDVIVLMERKGQSLKQIKRKINLLRRIIEKSDNPRATLITLADFGLFEKLLDQYCENQYNDEICLMISNFFISCLKVGKQPVQKEIVRVLRERPTNVFMVAVTTNLRQKFDKFVQRRTLKDNYLGFQLLNKEDQQDMLRPIKEAEEYYISTLEMLRWFCEGHYEPLQTFMRVQSYQGKNKPNQINMIEIVEDHLKRATSLLEVDNTKVCLTVLEFIVEIVQGPCVENQSELSKSKIIETLEDLSTTLINGFFYMKESKKSELINQVVLIFLGVIENNRDPLANSKVALSTNSDAFWDRLVQIQAMFDQDEEFFERNSPENKLTEDIADRLARVVDEDVKKKEKKSKKSRKSTEKSQIGSKSKKRKEILNASSVKKNSLVSGNQKSILKSGKSKEKSMSNKKNLMGTSQHLSANMSMKMSNLEEDRLNSQPSLINRPSRNSGMNVSLKASDRISMSNNNEGIIDEETPINEMDVLMAVQEAEEEQAEGGSLMAKDNGEANLEEIKEAEEHKEVEEEEEPSTENQDGEEKERKVMRLETLEDNKRPKKDISDMTMYTKDAIGYTPICEEGINITILFLQLMNYKPEYGKSIEDDFKIKKIGKNKHMLKKARETFFGIVKTIEVDKADKQIEKVFFPLPAITRFHSEDSKNLFNKNVDRTTSSSKLSGLTEVVQSILFEMKHFANLNKDGSNYRLTMVTEFRKLNFVLAVSANFIIMMFPDVNDEQSSTGIMRAFNFGNLVMIEWVLFGICCTLLTSYIVTMVYWFILAFAIEKKRIRNSEREELKQSLTQDQLDELKEDPYSELNKLLEISNFSLSYQVMTQTYLPVIIFLTLFCLLGLTLSKLFLAFLMIDIITLSPLLENVISAFSMKKKALIIVFMFGSVLIYIFTSIIYFTMLKQNWVFADDDDLEMCYNFLQCYIMTLNFGMRSGGGIGEVINYPYYEEATNLYIFRTIFDFTFFFAIIIIILEIVFGLIVDSFGELREERDLKGKPNYLKI